MENIKLCETCGKEHDGSYGSGRFCSYNCKQKFASVRGAKKSSEIIRQKYGKKCKCEACEAEFKTKLDLKKHLPNCEKRFKYNSISHNNWKCVYCDEVFGTRALLYMHRKDSHPNEAHRGGSHHIICYCKYCGRKNTTPNGNTVHEKSCMENPNRVSGSCKGKRLSEESKKKISEARKKYLEENPDKIPFKLNHSSKESYPEKHFREWLQKENILSEQEFQVGLYSLDFAWPDRMIYLEIDGGQHKLEWMQKHDKERTENLSQKGWTCIDRIFWPDYQKLNRENKEKYLSLLKEKLRPLAQQASAEDS